MATYKIETSMRGFQKKIKAWNVYKRNDKYEEELVNQDLTIGFVPPREWFLVAGGLRSEREAKDAIEHVEKESQFITK